MLLNITSTTTTTAMATAPPLLSRSISTLKKHPFIASSLILAISTPPIFRILLFFWPLIFSTALCVLAVVTFAPHSGGTAAFVELDNESTSTITVARQQVNSAQQRHLHSSIVYPSLMQVEENTWLEWLHNENCKQILAQSQAAASIAVDWENDNDNIQQVVGGSYRVLEQQTVSDEKIMVISSGYKAHVNASEEVLSKAKSDPINREDENSSYPEKDIHCQDEGSSHSEKEKISEDGYGDCGSQEEVNTIVQQGLQAQKDENQSPPLLDVQTNVHLQNAGGATQNTSSLKNPVHSKNDAMNEKSKEDESFSFYPRSSSSTSEEYSKNVHDQYGETMTAKH